jgi:hypothetical protein
MGSSRTKNYVSNILESFALNVPFSIVPAFVS